MAPGQKPKATGRGRQPTAEPEEGGETSGENGGELIANTTGNIGDQTNTPPALPILPGFSEQQVNSMMGFIQTVVHTTLQQYLSQQNPVPNTTPLATIELPEPPPAPATPYHTDAHQIRAEEVGYFDPEYQQEQGTNGPIINAGKYVYYRDVYIFVDRLKDLATTQTEGVKGVISACFRGSALMWYSMELTDLERDLLRGADLDKWYTTLINRFKTRTSVALSQLIGQTYSLADVKHTSPRAFMQQMLHLAKSAEFNSTYNQLTLLWNQFAVSLRRDIPEPRPSTTLRQFFEQVDSKTPIWQELAYRGTQQPQRWQQGPTLHDPTLGRPTTWQKGTPPQQQASYKGNNNNKFPPRLAINDGKAHAYLADVTPDGYGVYEEEGEANQEQYT